MSTDKYTKHLKSKYSKIVVTEQDGTKHFFKSEKEYRDSDFVKKVKNEKRDIIRKRLLKAEREELRNR